MEQIEGDGEGRNMRDKITFLLSFLFYPKPPSPLILAYDWEYGHASRPDLTLIMHGLTVNWSMVDQT